MENYIVNGQEMSEDDVVDMVRKERKKRREEKYRMAQMGKRKKELVIEKLSTYSHQIKLLGDLYSEHGDKDLLDDGLREIIRRMTGVLFYKV